MNRGIVSFLIASTLIVGCGLNVSTSGSGTSPNDPAPSTPPVAQGQFFAASGQTGITGSAIVYFTNGSYIVRLEGLTVPTETGLQVVVNGNSGEIARLSLVASTGNQNYTISSAGTGAIFRSVAIFSSRTNSTYATAQFR